jgi:peptidoglycan/LPS O-acetylase OafA/YrhL
MMAADPLPKPELECGRRGSGDSPHYSHLDGVRGLAAMFVVLHHLWLASYGMRATNGLAGALTNWLLYGHLAVDVFIVLSGFCLTLPFARPGATGCVDIRRFYIRRGRRILPPFYAVLILSILLAEAAHILFGRLPSVRFNAISILANLLMLQDILPRLNIFNVPLWTVAIETKIYLLFPLFIYIHRRFGVGCMLLVACAIGYALTALAAVAAPAADLGHVCLWYVALFGMGMSAAFMITRGSSMQLNRLTVLCMVLFGGISLVLLQRFPVTAAGESAAFVPHLPYIDSAVGAFTASFLYWTTRSGGNFKGSNRAVAALSWRPLVVLGGFSYSLYLVHYPLIGYAGVFASKVFRITQESHRAILLFFLALPLIVFSAYIFYLAFERPFLSSTLKAGATRKALAT